MFKKTVILLFFLLCFPFGILKAEDTTPVPETITANCLLQDNWWIDYCPLYRQVISQKNKKLAQQRNQYYATWWLSYLRENLDKKIEWFTKQKITLGKSKPWIAELFLFDYETYITQLFRNYINWSSDETQLVSSFFRKTYFTSDQSGLSITNIKLYKGVSQYDAQVKVQISIRNFAKYTIDSIEDIYCFSTIGNQDLIFPLQVSNIFPKNSITNLVVDIPTKYSQFLDNYGKKKIACTIVYWEKDKEKYSNWWLLEFDLRP